MVDAARPLAEERIIRTRLPYALDPALGERARIGLIVLATDATIEHEWRQVLAIDGVAFYESRLYNAPQITPETLKAMESEIGHAASLILPEVPFDVVAYGCTSGAMAIGEERVFELIRTVRPEVECTTPITGAFAAFEALDAKRIALLTPYSEAVNAMLRDYIEARGVTVPVTGSFNEEHDVTAARISPDSIRAAVLDIGRLGDVDAVFVSCTSLKVIDVVEPLEAELGKPVTSSNLALAWHALRLAGVDDAIAGFGRLFRSGLAAD